MDRNMGMAGKYGPTEPCMKDNGNPDRQMGGAHFIILRGMCIMEIG